MADLDEIEGEEDVGDVLAYGDVHRDACIAETDVPSVDDEGCQSGRGTPYTDVVVARGKAADMGVGGDEG